MIYPHDMTSICMWKKYQSNFCWTFILEQTNLKQIIHIRVYNFYFLACKLEVISIKQDLIKAAGVGESVMLQPA